MELINSSSLGDGEGGGGGGNCPPCPYARYGTECEGDLERYKASSTTKILLSDLTRYLLRQGNCELQVDLIQNYKKGM